MKHQGVNLAVFQRSLAERVQEAKESQITGVDRRLGVLLGDLYFLVLLTDIQKILPVGTIVPVPLTKPWYLGLRSVNSRLVGVIDYVYCAHGIRQHIAPDSHILIPSIEALSGCGFLVSSVVDICDVHKMQQGVLIENGQSRAIYTDYAGRQWREVNWSILMQLSQFFEVAS